MLCHPRLGFCRVDGDGHMLLLPVLSACTQYTAAILVLLLKGNYVFPPVHRKMHRNVRNLPNLLSTGCAPPGHSNEALVCLCERCCPAEYRRLALLRGIFKIKAIVR